MVPRRSNAFVPGDEGVLFCPDRCLTPEPGILLKDLELQEKKIVTQLLFLEDDNIKEVARPTISNILPWDETFQILRLIRT